MEGVSINPVEEVFVVSGEHLEYPGDRRGGSPGNTINCRCGTIPIVVNDPRQRRELKPARFAKNLTASREWLQDQILGDGDSEVRALFEQKMAEALAEYHVNGEPGPNGEEPVGLLNAEGNGDGGES